MYDTGIADRLRAAGLSVIEVAGWQTRGRSSFNPQGSVHHHTAGPRRGNAPSLAICTYGRSDLPGPLCHVLMGRDNVCYVVAAGRANHAGTGGWKGLIGNSSVYGLEHENTGYATTEPWRPDQVDAAATAHAALIAGRADSSMVCLHREWTSRKPDAHTIHGPTFRAMVAQRLSAAPAPTPPPVTPVPPPPSTGQTYPGDPDMFLAVNNYGFFVIVDGVPIAFPDMQSFGHAKNNSSNVPYVWLEREQGEPLIQNLLQQLAKP